jgi:RNA-directed DNA polymerase
MEMTFERITNIVNKHKKIQTLMYHVNKELLIVEHNNQSGNKASGIDKVTKQTYGENLNKNIDNLVTKMKTLQYIPQPVRRTYIPKVGNDNKMRPLGIPAYEDKLVQGIMAKLLNAVYEQKFLDFSYGFRPNRSCHQAIKQLDMILMKCKANYIVDADIKVIAS